jgi:hypothetical protein
MESPLGATHMVEVGVMMLLAFSLGKNMIFVHPINFFVHLKSFCALFFFFFVLEGLRENAILLIR